MGTLMGHILPGTFFGLFAIWWGFCIAVKHFHCQHLTKKARRPYQYRSTITFQCMCCPSILRNIPFESYLKLLCVSIGILGEAVTGLKHPYDDALKRKKWTFIEANAQHITMFFSFGLASLIEILIHAKYALPKRIDFIANTLAFAVEGFLFYFHLHGRDEIDIHVHTLLVYNISFCVLAGIWEYNRPNQILATYCRIAATLLQGAWFYAAGFILYFPSDDPYWKWLPSHGSILIITVIFIWLGLLACIFLFIQSVIVWRILKQRYHNADRYFALDTDDNDEASNRIRITNGNNHQLKNLTINKENSTVNLNNQNSEDGDSDTEIDLHQNKTITKSTYNMP